MHVCFISRSNLDIFFLNSKTLIFFPTSIFPLCMSEVFWPYFQTFERRILYRSLESSILLAKPMKLLSFTLESCVFLTLHRQKKHKPSAPYRTSRFHRALDISEDLVDTVVFYLPKACSGASKSECLHDNQLSSIV